MLKLSPTTYYNQIWYLEIEITTNELSWADFRLTHYADIEKCRLIAFMNRFRGAITKARVQSDFHFFSA